MQKVNGKSIFKGIAIGKILFYHKGEQQVKRTKIEDAEAELRRYEAASKTAVEQLNELYKKAVTEVGEMNAAVFEVHAMMVQDGDYVDSIRNMIETQHVNTEYAVAATGDNFSKMFAEMDDDYFKARAADVKDISERIIHILNGSENCWNLGDEPVFLEMGIDELSVSPTFVLPLRKTIREINIEESRG